MPAQDLLSQALRNREMQAERNINLIRGAGIVLASLVDLAYNLFHRHWDSSALVWMLISVGIAVGYTSTIHRLTSRETYRPWLKYLTISLDYGLLCFVFVMIRRLRLFENFSLDTLYGTFVAWLFLVNILSAFRRGRLVVAYSTVLGSLSALLIALLYLDSSFFLYPVFLMAGFGLIVQILSSSNTQLFIGLRRKEQLMRFLSRPLVESIESGEVDLHLGGTKQRVTILLTDIRGFTRFSESRDPLEVVDTLNEYFSAMTAIVFANGGTVDKYIGDAILAVFGTPQGKPDDARRAVRTAEEMLLKLSDLNQRWTTQGRPQLSMGAALHTGDVVVGNIGSPERMEYTVIGDVVNVTSRIESLNKKYNTTLLLSESTLEAVADSLQTTSVGECVVRGRSQPVRLYSLEST